MVRYLIYQLWCTGLLFPLNFSPTNSWPREPEERDGWLREPDDSAVMEAYFDAKCGGEDGDWADIAFEVSLYEY